MIGYKVVNDKYKSVIMDILSKTYTLEYIVGTTVMALPHTLGVFFFKELEDAMYFTNPGNIILAIEVPESANPRSRKFAYHHYIVENDYFHRCHPDFETPIGTWTADFVTVVKEISSKEYLP